MGNNILGALRMDGGDYMCPEPSFAEGDLPPKTTNVEDLEPGAWIGPSRIAFVSFPTVEYVCLENVKEDLWGNGFD